MHICPGHMTAVTAEINYRLVTSPTVKCLGAAWVPKRGGSPRVTMSSLHLLLRCCYGFKQAWFEIHATFLASDLQLHLRRGSSIHFLCCHDAAAEQMPAHHPLSYTNIVFYCYVFMSAVIQNSFTRLKSSAMTILTPGHGRHLSDTQNTIN